MSDTLMKSSIRTSFYIGLPVGLFAIIMIFITPVALTGEGLTTIFLFMTYGKAIIGLIITFLFALWFAGKNIYKDIIAKRKLLFCSFRYSLTVNVIIWTTFILVTIMTNLEKLDLLIVTAPIVAFILSVISTTFTLGLLICYIVKNNLKNIRT